MVSLAEQNLESETSGLFTFYLNCGKGVGNSANPIHGQLSDAQSFTTILKFQVGRFLLL